MYKLTTQYRGQTRSRFVYLGKSKSLRFRFLGLGLDSLPSSHSRSVEIPAEERWHSSQKGEGSMILHVCVGGGGWEGEELERDREMGMCK